MISDISFYCLINVEKIKLFEGPLADLDAAASQDDVKRFGLPSTEASGNTFKPDTEDVSSLLK